MSDKKFKRKKSPNFCDKEYDTADRRSNSKDFKDKRMGQRNKYVDPANDPEWYSADPTLLRDSASIPFSFASGINYNLGTLSRDGDDLLVDYSHLDLPGIASIRLLPTLGRATGVKSAVNVAATSMYAFIRKANSGARNYDSMDLMIYTYAMAHVFSALNWLQRTYGTAMMFAQRNRFIPEGVIKSQHIDYNSVVRNLADFRLAINVLINKVASMVVPSDMPIFKRLAFLYSNVYSEGESIKDQMYMYTPAGFYKYSHEEDGKGYLEFKELPGSPESPVSYTEMIDYVNSLIEPIWLDEDSNTISGDILKAYGDKVLQLVQIPETFILSPVYVKEVLEQIHNATIVPSTILVSLNAHQQIDTEGGDTRGWLKCEPTAEMAGAGQFNSCYAGLKKIMTTHNLAPEPKDIMVNSRLMVQGELFRNTEDENKLQMHLFSGSEIVQGVDIYVYEGSALVKHEMPAHWNILNSAWWDDYKDTFHYMSQFDYLPLSPVISSDGIGEYPLMHIKGFVGDIDNFAVIDGINIKSMHDAATLNLYNVPIASIIR